MHVVVVAHASRVLYWPVHCLTLEFLILFERLLREYVTVVRVFFKTNVTVSAVTVSVVKTNVFCTLGNTWVCIYAYLHYMAGLGLNFGRPKTAGAGSF